MANAENRPGSPVPQLPQETPAVPFPVAATNGEVFVNGAVQEDGTLGVEFQREEDVFLAALVSPENTVRLAAVIRPADLEKAATASTEPLTANVTRRKDGTDILRVQRGSEVVFDASLSPFGHLRLIFNAATLDHRPLPEIAAPDKEQEQETVKVWGNLSKVFTLVDGRATFLFAEHPGKDAGCEEAYRSFYNTLPDEEKKRHRFADGTVFHTVLATKSRVAMLEAAATTDQSVLTCYPHTWQEQGDNGRMKTVRGLVLVNWEPMEVYKPKEEKKKGKRTKNGQGYPDGSSPLLPESTS